MKAERYSPTENFGFEAKMAQPPNKTLKR